MQTVKNRHQILIAKFDFRHETDKAMCTYAYQAKLINEHRQQGVLANTEFRHSTAQVKTKHYLRRSDMIELRHRKGKGMMEFSLSIVTINKTRNISKRRRSNFAKKYTSRSPKTV